MSDIPASDRDLASVANLIGDPARAAMLAALVDGRALPAAITSVFIARGWLTRGPGRSLRVADDYDDNLEKWLAT